MMAAIKNCSEHFIEVYGKIFLWLYVFNSLKYAYDMPRTSRNFSAKFSFKIQFYDVFWNGWLLFIILKCVPTL